MQKISIIRALLRSPEILFLDEATSNLDSKTVKLVGKEIEDFKGTIINITHKPEHFSNAEKTYLIDNKNLIEI